MLLGSIFQSMGQGLMLLLLCLGIIGYRLASFAKGEPGTAMSWVKFLFGMFSNKR